jgi:hypothetical protein
MCHSRRLLLVLAGLLMVWFLAAYWIVPSLWRDRARHDPALADAPRITHTASGIPGDPLNLALIGAEPDVVRAFTVAGWFPADPITFDTSMRIAVDAVLRRPDDEAPVSDLYLFGRKQDLAFEQPVPGGPRHRHHVRCWRWDRERAGRPVWFASVTYDERVGFSHTTGQITHHIAPDVDAERDRLAAEFQVAGVVEQLAWVDGFQSPPSGKNGGGDPWHTDGRLAVVTLKPTPALVEAGTNRVPTR